MSFLDQLQKCPGSLLSAEENEPSVALQHSARSLAELKRFPPLFLSLSIQSLKRGVRLCAETETLQGTVHLLPTESRLLRHKAQPPLPHSTSPPPPFTDLVVNLFGYSCTKKGGVGVQRIERLLWREDIGEQTLVPPSSVQWK